MISVDDFKVSSDNLVGVDKSLSWTKEMLFGFYLGRLDNVLPCCFV